MKLSTECAPCLLKRAAYEVELCAPEKVMEAIRECSRVASEKASEKLSSAEFASAIHKCAYGIIGKDDPYFDLKRRSNEIALKLYPEAEKFVENSRHPLRAAMVVSIIGNLLDFGIAGSIGKPEELKGEFLKLIREPMGWDDSAEIGGSLKKADEIFFLADNCGEIVFDRLLLQQIRTLGKKKIVMVIKGKPILTDVTRKDLKGLQMDRLVDEIMETEGLAVGLDLWTKERNADLVRRMRRADLIISKGMANFEALSEFNWKAVAYMLRVKCRPVSKTLGVDVDKNAIVLVRSKSGLRR